MKNTLLFALLLFLGLTGCNSGQEQLQEKIAKQEEALEGESDPETAEALLGNYQAYVDQYPEDTTWAPRYLYLAAGVQFRLNRFSAAADLLQQAIREYHASENTPNSALMLQDIYEEKMRNRENALTVLQAFAKQYPDHAATADIRSRLAKDSIPALADRLQAMRYGMYDDSTGRINFRLANDFINSSELHAIILPDDPQSPELLHQAGETARTIRSFPKALAIYEWISDAYPDHKRAPQALFLRAFILDNDLKRFDEARVLYEDFLARYPEDDFADDTQFLLDNLGKNDEEIIRSFSQGEEQQ